MSFQRRCPICGRELEHSSWNDELGYTEEYYQRCIKGHYGHHWAFGFLEMKLGKFEVGFTDHNYIKGEELEYSKKCWNLYWKYFRAYRRKRNKRR